MLIREFTEDPRLKDVDLLDDLHFFMHNDPQFYRKELYPLIAQLKKHVKSGKRCEHTLFRKCVDKAVDHYCQKFKITGNPKSVFTDVDRDSVARKVFAQEQENISKGAYDGEAK